MRALTPDAEEFFTDLRNEYLTRLEREFDVGTAEDYLEFADATSRLRDRDEILQFLSSQQYQPDIFIEFTPHLNQNIVYSSLNPGMHSTIKRKHFVSGHYGRTSETNGDVEEIAWQRAKHFNTYLTDSSNWGVRTIVSKLQDTIGDSSMTYEDYVDVDQPSDLETSYYGDVYHTRFFKLASPDGGFLHKFDKNHWRSRFADELIMTSPRLVVTGCRDAWLSIHDHMVEDPMDEITPHNSSTVTRDYGNGSDSAPGGVFEIPERNMWVVTIFHESFPHLIDFDSFDANLNFVNQRL